MIQASRFVESPVPSLHFIPNSIFTSGERSCCGSILVLVAALLSFVCMSSLVMVDVFACVGVVEEDGGTFPIPQTAQLFNSA